MEKKIFLSLIFAIPWLALYAQNKETMVSILFNADESDFMGIPIMHNYWGIVVPESIDSTYKIVYSDSSEMNVVKIGKQISFIFKKEKTVLTGQFNVSPCPLSEFVARYNFDLNEYVVYKNEYFTAYRIGTWKLTNGSETRNLVCLPVRFVEPCK